MNFASIFWTGSQWRLVIHKNPSVKADSVIQVMLFDCKSRAKVWADNLGCKAWNY